MMSADQTVTAVLNRLAKWRSIFAGWQLGTRSVNDAECQAVRDHREATILLRVEVSALTAALMEKMPGFEEAFRKHLLAEAEELQKMYEARFPGIKATDHGMQIDARAAEYMKHWRP